MGAAQQWVWFSWFLCFVGETFGFALVVVVLLHDLTSQCYFVVPIPARQRRPVLLSVFKQFEGDGGCPLFGFSRILVHFHADDVPFNSGDVAPSRAIDGVGCGQVKEENEENEEGGSGVVERWDTHGSASLTAVAVCAYVASCTSGNL